MATILAETDVKKMNNKLKKSVLTSLAAIADASFEGCQNGCLCCGEVNEIAAGLIFDIKTSTNKERHENDSIEL